MTRIIRVLCLLVTSGASFSPIGGSSAAGRASDLLAAPASSDFEKPQSVSNEASVDPNIYNVPVDTAAELWTVSVSPETKAGRMAGIPFLDCKSKDYFVDDVRVTVSRVGGMGLTLLELAGGRTDSVGITIIEEVAGNAFAAGVLPGDSISSIQVKTQSVDGTNVQETQDNYSCECRDFDATMALLTSIPPEVNSLVLNLKRIRRWPKVNVVVEYPPSQCAEGVDNKVLVELFAGKTYAEPSKIVGLSWKTVLPGNATSVVGSAL
jgi:hypothetical protein